MKTLIKNGLVIDPSRGLEAIKDIVVEDGRIAAVEDRAECLADVSINAAGCHVYPGFIDMHVHFREPGFEYKETVATGSQAAAAGGYTTVCAMPNTKPVIDTKERVEELLGIIDRDAVVKVLPIGSVTLGQNGKELTNLKELREAGVCGVSEDGKSVMDVALYTEAMQQAADLNMLVMAHCEDKDLVRGGVINEGLMARKIGLPGILNAVEDHITARDIILAGELGTRLHICHVSTELSADLVKLAKKKGFKVTAEVCPHHFSLSDSDIPGDDGNYKMNPPLRSKKDVEALQKALKEGVIDVISTDHAPHSAEEKAGGFETAPFGIVGLETAYALGVTNLVKTGVLSFSELVYRMSTRPAEILGLTALDGRGTLCPGAVADITIANPSEKWIVDASKFRSKGKNTPFNGEFLHGRVKLTMVDGKMVFE